MTQNLFEAYYEYETLARIATKAILSYIKDFVDGDEVQDFDTIDMDYFDIPIDVELYIEKDFDIDGFVTDATISQYVEGDVEVKNNVRPDCDDDNECFIHISIFINPDSTPKIYTDLYFKILEEMRHELEHVAQGHTQIEPEMDRETPTKSIDSSMFDHHRQPDEVEALVSGFYIEAKKRRKPLRLIMLKDLNYEIKRGKLTQEEADILYKLWVNYAKRRFPKAII